MPRPRRHHHLRWLTEISVTPLLDLVFILLFAFMVALPLVSRSDALFPPSENRMSASATSAAPTDIATLTMDRQENLSWQGQSTGWSEIPDLIASALQRQPQLGVLVMVPSDQTVASLAKVMSVLSKAGVRHTAIEVTESKR